MCLLGVISTRCTSLKLWDAHRLSFLPITAQIWEAHVRTLRKHMARTRDLLVECLPDAALLWNQAVLLFLGTGFPTTQAHYVAEDVLILQLLPLPPEYWGHRQVPL